MPDTIPLSNPWLFILLLAGGSFLLAGKMLQMWLGCRSCKRLFTRILIRRESNNQEVERSISKHGMAQLFRDPKIAAWREHSETVYEIETMHYQCTACGHTWTEKNRKRLDTRIDIEDRPPDEFPFT